MSDDRLRTAWREWQRNDSARNRATLLYERLRAHDSPCSHCAGLGGWPCSECGRIGCGIDHFDAPLATGARVQHADADGQRCRICGGTGQTLRGLAELAAYGGDGAARRVFTPDMCRDAGQVLELHNDAVTFDDWLRGFDRWGGLLLLRVGLAGARAVLDHVSPYGHDDCFNAVFDCAAALKVCAAVQDYLANPVEQTRDVWLRSWELCGYQPWRGEHEPFAERRITWLPSPPPRSFEHLPWGSHAEGVWTSVLTAHIQRAAEASSEAAVRVAVRDQVAGWAMDQLLNC